MSAAVPTPLEEAITRVFAGVRRGQPRGAAPPSPRLFREAIEAPWEICAHARQRLRRATSAEVRRREQRAWLRSALSAFQPTPFCHVAIGPRDSAWVPVDTGAGPDWLADLALSRDDGAPGGPGSSPLRSRQGDGLEDLTIVTEGAERALLLQTHEDELFSFQLPVSVLVDRAVSFQRIHGAAAKIRSIRAVRRPSYSPCVPVETMRNGPATVRHAGAGPTQEERKGLFVLGLAALAEADRKEREARPEEQRGPAAGAGKYTVATGTEGTLAWQLVQAQDTPSWLEDLWTGASLDRLFVSAPDGDHVLAFVANEKGIEMIVNRLDDVRAA